MADRQEVQRCPEPSRSVLMSVQLKTTAKAETLVNVEQNT